MKTRYHVLRWQYIFSSATAILLAAFAFVGCNANGSSESEPDQEGVLYNVAGIAGTPGSDGDGGNALSAHLAYPQDVTVNSAGEVFIVDAQNNCIRLVQSNGTITRYIGSGNRGDGSSGKADQVDLDNPASITIGPTGDIWVASWKNCKIKLVNEVTSYLSVLIGTTQGFSGDGGPAAQAQLNLPSSVVFDESGNMYISDQVNQRIRKVDAGMIITTFAGSGESGHLDALGDSAEFSFPIGSNAVPGGRITWSHHPDGLLIADTENHMIRHINLETRMVYTIAGTGVPGYSGDGGPAIDAQLNYPTDILMIEDHEIYVADSRNHVIRKIDVVGNISTVAGTGIAGFSPDGTPAEDAKLNIPSGIFFVEEIRTLYIADTYNHQVKKVKLPR